MSSSGLSDRYANGDIEGFHRDGVWENDIAFDYIERWATKDPQAYYVHDSAGSFTYAQAHAMASRLATSMYGLGVRPGDRVLAQLPNWREFAIIYLAASRLGAILVPVLPVYRDDEVGYMIRYTDVKLAFWTPTFRSNRHLEMERRLRSTTPTLAHSIFVRSSPETVLEAHELRYEDLVGDPNDLAVDAPLVPKPDADDGHLICFTSGTESRPKGCYHTFNTYGFTARRLASPEVMDVRLGSVTLMPSPITHTTGLNTGVIIPLITGTAVYLMDIWDPMVALDLIGEYACTHSTAAAPFLRMLLDSYDPTRHELGSMRVWVCGGAPIPPQLAEDARSIGLSMLPCYGATEILVSSVCRLNDPPEKIVGSDGRALDGVELRIISGDGSEVASGVEGEVIHRGPGLMLGYWGDDELTKKTIDPEGYCHSGDLGRMDEDGYVRITGRLKDVIIRGGVNISVRSLEDHLLSHPKVAQIAVVAKPDAIMGERACAVVVPRGSAPTLEELCIWLRDDRRISIQYLPEHLIIVDALPMTESGKVQKAELRKLARDS